MVERPRKSKDEAIVEVTQLVLNESDLHQRIKYIIAKAAEKRIFKFCADYRHGLHQSVFQQAFDEGKLPLDYWPIGGGYVRFLGGFHGQSPTLELDGISSDFGREPADVRQMALPIVLAKLKELGIDVQ